MTDDPIMAEIIAAASGMRGGDRTGGREALEAVWARIAADPQPMHEMSLAHSLADAQDDPAEELAWDLRALAAADRCTDAEAQRHSQAPAVAAFRPSLHVNLAEDYLRLGDRTRAGQHLVLARGFADHLGEDSYRRMIRGGIDRLARRLEAA